MSESISNIRNVPVTHPVKPVAEPDRDREPNKQDIDQEEPKESGEDSSSSDNTGDQDKPLLDEYV